MRCKIENIERAELERLSIFDVFLELLQLSFVVLFLLFQMWFITKVFEFKRGY